MHSHSPKLLIDCSSTICCEFNTGIQRVVRRICEQANEGVGCLTALPVYGRSGQWFQAQSLWPQSSHKALLAAVCKSHIARAYRQAALTVHRRLGSKRFQKLFLPEPGHAGIFKLPKLALEQVGHLLDTGAARSRPLEVQRGDILLMADASWMSPNWEAVAAARRRGAIVGNIIYDLIPITHPQFFPDQVVKYFTAWFERVACESDFFLCISHCVATELRKQLQLRGKTSEQVANVCQVFPLGADILSSPTDEGVCQEFKNIFGGEKHLNPHLIIGTIEPRKNHSFVLDAFDQLWSNGSQEKLCIVGKVGWNCQALIRRIQSHAEYGSKLFLHNFASDSDVCFAYRHAKSLIMASHTEGFGLPIIEALEFDQTVLASDTPIHREVGSHKANYFPLNLGCAPLVALIEACDCVETKQVRDTGSSGVTSWSESFGCVVDCTLETVAYLQSGSAEPREAA